MNGDRNGNDEDYFSEVVEVPIEREIDLHTFHPGDVAEVVEEYIYQCHLRGFAEVRIVHGKGRQVLRRVVISVVKRNEYVASYSSASPERGGHGATIVKLRTGDRDL
jgi:DNA-nicking Smr family endonuclease